MSRIQDGAEDHEDDKLKTDSQDRLAALLYGEEEACQEISSNPCEQIQRNEEYNIFHRPELKMGDGGGCMTFCAVAKVILNVMM